MRRVYGKKIQKFANSKAMCVRHEIRVYALFVIWW